MAAVRFRALPILTATGSKKWRMREPAYYFYCLNRFRRRKKKKEKQHSQHIKPKIVLHLLH